MKRKLFLWLSLSLVVLLGQTALPAGFVSHPPMRPLPEASKRPMDKGPSFFVDAKKGDDQNDGSKDKPWKTLQHAIEKSTPGITLYLRAGVFYEHVSLTKSGEPSKPITIRSYPGELAILDGGVREFYENPESSWEPANDGASNEYVSKQAFLRSGKEKVSGQFVNDDDEPFTGAEDDRPLALGNFGDSMVTIHGYRFLRDLRASEDGIWRLKGKDDSEVGLYVGPGLWFDRKEGRVHIRLAPTKFDWLGEEGNYRGETDPRKIPLVIAVGHENDVLDIQKARHIRVQDLVLRGAAGRAMIGIESSEDIELDGLTVFGGSPSLLGNSTKNLRVLNCAFRSLGSAPWESRASMKYRGTPSYIIIAREGKPQNQDWEIAHCEFTDGHDFAYFRWIHNLRFHHNFVENFNDDGMEFGPRTIDQLAWVYCNLITQTEIVLSQHEVDREPPDQLKVNPGTGTYVFRNIIDLRKPTYCQPKRTDDEALRAKGKSPSVWRVSGLCGDHGTPVWAQYFFYHNTVLKADPAWRDHYGFGLGEEGLLGKSHIGAKLADVRSPRRVFNNIFVQTEGLPGLVLAAKPNDVDLQADGNLLWSVEQGPSFKGVFFAKLRNSPIFEESKKQYPPGWGANDRFGDPKFTRFPVKNGSHEDLSLQKDSPALKAGVAIPAEWPDPLRSKKAGSPDIGAVPSGVPLWKVGVNDRLEVCPSHN